MVTAELMSFFWSYSQFSVQEVTLVWVSQLCDIQIKRLDEINTRGLSRMGFKVLKCEFTANKPTGSKTVKLAVG